MAPATITSRGPAVAPDRDPDLHQGLPHALRRPLGFPVGEGAPGPVAVVVGGPADAVRLAEVVRRLGAAGLPLRTDDGDDGPDGSDDSDASRGARLGACVTSLAAAFAEHRPSAVVVRGGSTTAVAGALAANAAGLPLVHVEAGLRSFDRRVPEEHHQVVVDHLADLCCAPTATAVRNLRAEGVPDDRILLTGSTVVESVLGLLPTPARQAQLLDDLGLPAGFVLVALARPETTDSPAVLRQVLTELRSAAVRTGLPVVLTAGARTADRLRENGFGDLVEDFTVLPPQPPAEFLALVDAARLVVSDAAGLQDEVSVLKKPLLVVRRSTDRPEVVGTFASLVPGGLRLAAAVDAALSRDPADLEALPSPYGDGSASRVIVESVVKLVVPY